MKMKLYCEGCKIKEKKAYKQVKARKNQHQGLGTEKICFAKKNIESI